MMRKVFFLYLCFVPFLSYAQISVEKVYEANMDISASTHKRLDINKEPCALIKVEANSSKVKFQGNIIGDVLYDAGEYWIYLSQGTKIFKIFHPEQAPITIEFPKYGITSLKGERTYVIRLNIPSFLSEEAFKIKKYSYRVKTACNEESSFEIDYPIQGNPNLLQNIREWIVEEVATNYDGDISDAEALVNYCRGIDKVDEEGSGTVSIEVAYEDSKIITFINTSTYHFEGAAGASWGVEGATFRKIDGKKFTKRNLHLSMSDFQPIIKNKLKQYFEVQTDEELRSYLHLQDPYNIDNIPLPEYNDPWITSDGIVFHYSKYEIAAGAYAVNFTISKDIIRQYVSPTIYNAFF